MSTYTDSMCDQEKDIGIMFDHGLTFYAHIQSTLNNANLETSYAV